MPPSSFQKPPVRPQTVGTPEASRPPVPPDRWRQRLFWGVLVSVAINAVLWPIIAQVVRSHVFTPLPPLTFRRIILPSRHKPAPNKVIHTVIKPKPAIKSQHIVYRKPVTHHIPVVLPQPVSVQHMPVTPPRLPRRSPSPASYQHISAAKGPTAAPHTARPGGHIPVGIPTERQLPGDGHDTAQTLSISSSPTPLVIAPQPPSYLPPLPVHQTSAPTLPSPPKSAAPTPSVGPTRDAQPKDQILPEIPDELKSGDYQSYVRVKLEIAVDGSFSVSLITSSGNREVDKRVLEALKRWKWKPALQNGQPIASTARFRFDFEVQ